MTARRTVRVAIERWPLIRPFTISRGTETEVSVVLVSCTAGGFVGRGEATPYAHYGETPESVAAAIEAARPLLEHTDAPSAEGAGLSGAAANAVDCALLDLACKTQGKRIWELLDVPPPRPLQTAMTIGLDSPSAMAAQAQDMPPDALVKLKLGRADGDLDRVAAVRATQPDARLICDANEGWSVEALVGLAPRLYALGVELIEQPLPAADDAALTGLSLPVPICADESCHTARDIDRLATRYDGVNVKLDKAGGLTGARALIAAARQREMLVFAGCMLGTSLAMAPGVIAAQNADFVDLDGPLTLKRDREPSLLYDAGWVFPPAQVLWG